MANRWQTYPVSFTEGELTSLPLIEQGISVPGSARTLLNLEVSPEGGYRSINGYVKYDVNPVPPYGLPFVLGNGQTGTTLTVVNTSLEIAAGSVFQINGTGQSYTVVSSVFTASTRRNVLTITPSLVVSPSDKATLVFTSTTGPRIEGVSILTTGGVVVKRGGALWESGGAGWTHVSAPYYGSVTVNAGPHSTSQLTLQGITVGPIQVGDCFTVDGYENTFTVLTAGPLTSGECTITFTPDIASVPSLNTPVSFVGAGLSHGTGKIKTTVYRFGSECKVGYVDGVSKPFSIGCTTKRFQWLTNAPADATGATSIAHLRNSLFFGKQSMLVFTAPASDNDFDTGNGAGAINVGSRIVSLTPFKDNLVVFSTNKIDVLRGSSSADFQFTSLTDRIGCVSGDTPLEVGGDILYLSPDGVRFLSDIDRSGDFGIDIASDKIKTSIVKFIREHESFQSVLLRDKNQYRLFGYRESIEEKFNRGFCGTQFGGQGLNDVRWSQLKGFKVYSATSLFVEDGELVVFSNETPYIYRMDTGTTFDGKEIPWVYESPWWSLSDPVTRKTFYKAHVYTKLTGSFEALFNLQLDFNEKSVVKPSLLTIDTTQGTFSTYGDPSIVYGSATYGGFPQVLFGVQTVGNGGVFSIKLSGNQIVSNFTLDNIVIEFGQKGRK